MSSDEELVARLRGLLAEHDPVPPEVVDAAQDSYAWRTVDAELARLAADSLLVTDRVRGDPARLLTFRADGTTVEVEVSESVGRLRVLGQVMPPFEGRLRVEQPGSTIEVEVGRLGRFAVENLRPGPTRLRWTPTGDRLLCTEWTVL
jgi:hypothetical protein